MNSRLVDRFDRLDREDRLGRLDTEAKLWLELVFELKLELSLQLISELMQADDKLSAGLDCGEWLSRERLAEFGFFIAI